MKTIEINLYSVKELDEDAKEKAFNEYCGSEQYFWGDDNKATLNEFERIFPVIIKDWRYGGGNSYINFCFTNDDDIENLSGVRLLKYLINNYYDYLYEPKTFTKNKMYTTNNKKRKSKIIYQKNDCRLTGYCLDCDILEPIYEFLKKPNKYITFYDLMNDCLQSWLSACEKDYEYTYSEEAFIETSEANEWYYTKDGEFYASIREAS